MTSHYTLRIALRIAFVAALGAVYILGRGDQSTSHTWSETYGFRFREVSAEAGISFIHEAPDLDPSLDTIAPHVAAVGASVSISDTNADGWPDLYFTSSRFDAPNALYINQKDGSFSDDAVAAGIADVNRKGEGVSMGSVWGDFDNDGFEDLFVYTYGYPHLFRNRGDGTFQDVTKPAGLRRWMNSNTAVWFDYDRDGFLDLYVGGYFREDVDLWRLETTQIMHDSFEFASNGGKNRLYRNLGDGRFEDVTDVMQVGSTRWTLAAAAADFNGDGWADLYLGNDYGPEELFLNRGGERFDPAMGGLADDSKSGMSVSLGDTENRGRLDVFVTNISERGYLFQGNNLRLNLLEEMGQFLNVAQGAVADAGWAWGAQFGDMNNDGFADLYITNGFISQNRDRDYWYGMSKIAGATGVLFQDFQNWPPIGDASLSGYEQSRVLMNMGEGRMVDVAPAVGVTDSLDGRAVAFADLFNRGMLDAVVASQRGPALLYRNAVDPTLHWIAFHLTGTRSNRSAIGAHVVAEWGDRTQMKVIDGGMGFASQNDRRIHFGLGTFDEVERVSITWPSGHRQVIDRPAVDRLHTIEEPIP